MTRIMTVHFFRGAEDSVKNRSCHYNVHWITVCYENQLWCHYDGPQRFTCLDANDFLKGSTSRYNRMQLMPHIVFWWWFWWRIQGRTCAKLGGNVLFRPCMDWRHEIDQGPIHVSHAQRAAQVGVPEGIFFKTSHFPVNTSKRSIVFKGLPS